MGELATELNALRGSSDEATIRVAMDALADSAQARGYSAISQADVVYDAALAVLVDAGRVAIPYVRRNTSHSDPYVRAAFQCVVDRLSNSFQEESLRQESLRMAKLRIQDLNNQEFEISKSSPPSLQGQQLKAALAAVGNRKIFLEYDETIDGPQTASRLIREAMSSYGTVFVPTISDADLAVWIGGTGNMMFTFVVLDGKDYSRYLCYLCGPRELTSCIMSTMAQFCGRQQQKPWWKFWS
jgi:hypothetical protein